MGGGGELKHCSDSISTEYILELSVIETFTVIGDVEKSELVTDTVKLSVDSRLLSLRMEMDRQLRLVLASNDRAAAVT